MGEIPSEIIINVSKWLVYNSAVGNSDLKGDGWGHIFAKSIGGQHLASPVGLDDVVLDCNAWSAKSVKNSNAHACRKIRLICGRNAIEYSYGIQNALEDPQLSGRAVLDIWNARVDLALSKYSSFRGVVLVRDSNRFKFTMFETEITQYSTEEYSWRVNKNGNLEGFDKSGHHKFTWQPNGTQFTIKYDVPSSATRFELKRPPALDFETILAGVGFSEDWITIQ